MTDYFFYLGVSFILLHEMDAVRCKEWRIFPGLSLLGDGMGFKVFMVAHIPLFFFLFWGLLQPENGKLILGLNIFFVVHLVLHILFLKHRKNEFKDLISWTIIFGAGICGMAGLLLN